MKLTVEQKQEIIDTLKKQYSDTMEWLLKEATQALYESTPEILEMSAESNEIVRSYYERLEKIDNLEIDTNDKDWLSIAFSLAIKLLEYNGAKDGE